LIRILTTIPDLYRHHFDDYGITTIVQLISALGIIIDNSSNPWEFWCGGPGVPKKLVATFDSEEQLRAYVRWATLFERAGVFQFEKGSALAGYHQYGYSSEPRTDEDATAVDHNPSPSML
jgi:hypothetical protein